MRQCGDRTIETQYRPRTSALVAVLTILLSMTGCTSSNLVQGVRGNAANEKPKNEKRPGSDDADAGRRDDRGIDEPGMTTGTYLHCGEIPSANGAQRDDREIRIGCLIRSKDTGAVVADGADQSRVAWNVDTTSIGDRRVSVRQNVPGEPWQQEFVFSGLPREELARVIAEVAIVATEILAANSTRMATILRETIRVLLPVLLPPPGGLTPPTSTTTTTLPTGRPPEIPPAQPQVPPAQPQTPQANPPPPGQPGDAPRIDDGAVTVTVSLRDDSSSSSSVLVAFPDPSGISALAVVAGNISLSQPAIAPGAISGTVEVPLTISFEKDGRACSGSVTLRGAAAQTISIPCGGNP